MTSPADPTTGAHPLDPDIVGGGTSRRWPAPLAPAPIRGTVSVPGSKSETNRALILAALADGPSTITNGLDARDTRLMRDALRALGVMITESGQSWRIEPPTDFVPGATIACGLAGTVMRFLPPVAALAAGEVAFDADEQAYRRPMGVLLDALRELGATVADDATRLPFRLTGRPDLPGGVITIDASASSQFVSALLLVGARLSQGLDLRHDGKPVPSQPHIEMTVAMLRERGVIIDDAEPARWVVSPGPIAALDVDVEPDLSNAAPFLAAAAITGGSVTVVNWPERTHQPGDQLREIFTQFGASVGLNQAGLTVIGTDQINKVDLDLGEASELTPVVAAVAALADGTSHLRGVAHIRGHETDRLAALAAGLGNLGAHAEETDDGLTIHPKLLGGGLWHSHADHRMAQAGALLGLVVPDVIIDDIACTDKTMPEFVQLWEQLLADSARAAEASTPDPTDAAPDSTATAPDSTAAPGPVS